MRSIHINLLKKEKFISCLLFSAGACPPAITETQRPPLLVSKILIGVGGRRPVPTKLNFSIAYTTRISLSFLSQKSQHNQYSISPEKNLNTRAHTKV
jgi:hypothetical protein